LNRRHEALFISRDRSARVLKINWTDDSFRVIDEPGGWSGTVR